MKKKRQKQNGFTFIELMTVVAIIGIMTTVGFASLKTGQNQTKLKTAQAEIVALIKLAQSDALQGKEQGTVTPKYYGVKFSADGKSYIFCSNSNDADPNCSNFLQTYPLAGRVAISSGQNSLVRFDVPHGNCYLSSGSTLVVSLGIDSNTKTITISAGGAIAEN